MRVILYERWVGGEAAEERRTNLIATAVEQQVLRFAQDDNSSQDDNFSQDDLDQYDTPSAVIWAASSAPPSLGA